MHNLLIKEPPLLVLPTLAAKIGLNEAIFLQQLHYWLQLTKHHRDGKPWVYNKVSEWAKQFPFWSVPTIRRIINNLRDAGIVEVSDKYNRIPIDKTLWYTIDYARMESDQFDHSSDEIVTPCDQVDQSSDQIDHAERSDCASRSDQSDQMGNQKLPEVASDQIDHSNNQILPETTTETTGRESASAGADGLPPPVAQPVDEFDAVYGKGTVSFDPPPPTTPPKQSIQEDWNKPISEMPPHQAMFAAVLDAIGWDRKTLTERDRGQVAQTCRVLREAGYEYADVGEFMVRVWFRDWQWEKNQSRPSLNQLRRDIGKVKAGIPVEMPRRQSQGADAVDAFFDRLEKQGLYPQ